MRKGLTEVVFILDRSGSMSGLEADTIGGFNGMLEKQKSEAGEALVSLVLFDDQHDVVLNRVPIDKVRKITEKDYYVRGCTALLDAMGRSIKHLRKIQKELPEDERPDKTLFVITTDGMENASHQYTYEKIRKMVEKCKKKNGWEFIFLGANMDAIDVAKNFGIDKSRAATYKCDSAGTAMNFHAVGSILTKARACGSDVDFRKYMDAEDCLADIRDDFKKRG